MDKSTSEKINVGILVVVGTILLITALFFVGNRHHFFSKNILLYAVFTDVSGLQLGNNIRYSGVSIGTVSKIEMKEEGKVTVELSVDKDAARFIRKNAVATITSDGLVGRKVVNIIPGNDRSVPLVSNGDVIQVKTKVSIDDMLDTFSKTNESAALITSDLAKITQKIVDGKGTVGALMSDTIMATDIRRSILEFRNTAAGTSQAIAKVNGIISKINYEQSAAALLLSDKNSANQIKNVFNNLEKSSNNINAVTKNLDNYLTEIKTGKGSLNYLAKDEILSKNIDSTITNVKEAAEKLNENMEALKHNFLFRSYFKKIERKERKEALKN